MLMRPPPTFPLQLLWLDGHAEEDIINVAVLSILYNFVDDYQKLQCKKLGRLRIGLFESNVEEKVENGYSLGDFKNLKIFDYSNQFCDTIMGHLDLTDLS